jgi:hypothetical protein
MGDDSIGSGFDAKVIKIFALIRRVFGLLPILFERALPAWLYPRLRVSNFGGLY